jgi:hypothetical protein
MIQAPAAARALVARSRAVLWRNRRAVRDALVLAGIARAIWFYTVQGVQPLEWLGIDARAYWRVDLAHPYTHSLPLGTVSTFIYPPPLGQLLAPLSLFPFPLFYAVWTVMLIGVLIWLVRPWPWAALILILPVSYELFVGQIHLLIAAAIVVGFAHPSAWAFPVLTKLTPGVGLAWFAVRREWRALATALGAIGAVVALSFALSPSAWSDWIGFMTANAGQGDLVFVRFALGAVIVAFGGLTGRRWLVPVGVWIALPVVYIESWVVLLAIVRLVPRPFMLDVVADPTDDRVLPAAEPN